MAWQVRSWSDSGTGHNHVFAIQLPKQGGAPPPSGGGPDENSAHGGFEMLLLAADSPRDKYAACHPPVMTCGIAADGAYA